MKEIAETLRGVDNEATRSPYWLILDPIQNMDCSVFVLAQQIYGPFFCREDAQDYLDSHRYNFSKRAVVFCHSGHYSKKYDDFCRSILEGKK